MATGMTARQPSPKFGKRAQAIDVQEALIAKASNPTKPVETIAIPFEKLKVNAMLVVDSKLGDDIAEHNAKVAEAATEYDRTQAGLGTVDRLTVTPAELANERLSRIGGRLVALQAAWQLGVRAVELFEAIRREWATEQSALVALQPKLAEDIGKDLCESGGWSPTDARFAIAVRSTPRFQSHIEAERVAMRNANAQTQNELRPVSEPISALLDKTIAELRT